MTEEQRYAAIQEQIKQLLDAAAADDGPGGMVGLGSVWLASELYALTHQCDEKQTKESEEQA